MEDMILDLRFGTHTLLVNTSDDGTNTRVPMNSYSSAIAEWGVTQVHVDRPYLLPELSSHSTSCSKSLETMIPAAS